MPRTPSVLPQLIQKTASSADPSALALPDPSFTSHLQGKGSPGLSSSVMLFGLAPGLQIHDGTQPPGLGIFRFSCNMLKRMSVHLVPHLTPTVRKQRL